MLSKVSTGIKTKTYTKETTLRDGNASITAGSSTNVTKSVLLTKNLLEYSKLKISFTGRDSYQWVLGLTFWDFANGLIVSKTRTDTGSFSWEITQASFADYRYKWTLYLAQNPSWTGGAWQRHTFYNLKIIWTSTEKIKNIWGLPREDKDIWLYNTITTYWKHIDNTRYNWEI